MHIPLSSSVPLPAVYDDDDVLGSAGGGNVPGPDTRVIVIVEPCKVGVPFPAWVEPNQACRGPEVLPPTNTVMVHLIIDSILKQCLYGASLLRGALTIIFILYTNSYIAYKN